MAKLFQKKPDAEKRTVRLRTWTTAEEAAAIRAAAEARKLGVEEFIRRAALGRKADVDYTTDVVIALSTLTKAIRAFHADAVAAKVALPESELGTLIQEIGQAVLRITK